MILRAIEEEAARYLTWLVAYFTVSKVFHLVERQP